METPIGGGRGSGTPGRRALRVVAESFGVCPGQPAHSEALAAAGRGMGKIGVKSIPKGGGWLPRLPGERLAKRKAREEELVKCRSLPDDSGVQHGV